MGLIAINVWFSGYRLTARGSSLQLFPMKPSWQSNHYLKYIRAIDYKQTFCLLNRYSYVALSWSVKVKVTQSGLTLCDPMDSTVHIILQARKLEWVAFPFFRGPSDSRNWSQVSHIGGRFFFTARESQEDQWLHSYPVSNMRKNGSLWCKQYWLYYN